jgi:hypothetical protein
VTEYAPEAVTLQPFGLHGYPIIAMAPLPVEGGLRNSRVIICDRGVDNPERFVCAVHCYGDDEWTWGRYCSTIEEAYEHFIERLGRKYDLKYADLANRIVE